MTTFDTTGLESYITDPELETSGVWVAFGDGQRIRIKRAGGSNKAFARAFATAKKPYRRQIDRGTLDPETSSKIMRDVYSKSIVVEWEGINDSAGAPVECTERNIVEFFAALPELFDEIVSIAGELSTFSVSQDE